jgi:ribonuclease HII
MMIQDDFILSLIRRYKRPAFIDEVATGAIFGNITACAVMLPPGFENDRVNDSKQLKHEEIYDLAPRLEERVAYAIGESPAEEVSALKNIITADHKAMVRAVQALPEKPDVLFVDGKFTLPDSGIESYAVIRGDARVLGIAVASIIAKNHRDLKMISEYGEKFRIYDIASNKGYRSPRHLIAIRKYGVTEHHRAYMPQIQRVLNGSYDPIIFRKYPGYWRTV